MSSIKDLIAKQRASLEVQKQGDVEVALGGELVTVTIKRALPEEWDGLVASNPPRVGIETDKMIGYNANGVSRVYPHVSLNGEAVDSDTWTEVFDVLDSVHRNNIGVLIWGLNVNEALKELRELGKGRAGKESPSPAN